MHHIDLEGLLGTRESADDLLAKTQLPRDLQGETVVLYCRDLLTGSTSFADQLVKQLITNRGADEVVLVGAPVRFQQHMHAAATRRQVSGRVRTESAAKLSA